MPTPFARLTRLRAAPRVYVMDGFASAQECEHLRAAGADAERHERWGVETNHDETGFSFELPTDQDAVAGAVAARIEALLGVVNELGGTLRFRRYAPGEAHPPHVDNFRVGDLDLVATALLGLEGPQDGGETAFPDADPPLAVAAREGRLLVWLNCGADGAPDPYAEHEGRPVRRGTKTTVTNFIYSDPQTCELLRRGPLVLAATGA